MTEHRQTRVLVVDDDDQLRDLLTLVLQGEGFSVAEAGEADAALREIRRGEIDIVVLDVALGTGDGRAVLAEIRKLGEMPAIMISAHGEPADRVLALRLGADDFLVKPFSPVELVARIESILRRSRGPATGPSGGTSLEINERTREVVAQGRPVELTAREFDLLAFLAHSPRQVFTRGQLLQHVWESQTDWQDEATVTEHVRRIRRKVETDPDNPRWIVTVRGVGYKFEP
jgi:DNA-binding response OmpR family regulator